MTRKEIPQWNLMYVDRIQFTSRRRIGGRAMELVSGHESVLALSNREALSILDASFKFGGASCLVSGESWSTVRMEQISLDGIQCLLRSDWSLRWLYVCICTETSEKVFVFANGDGWRELASENGRVSERTRLKRSSRSIRVSSIASNDALRSIVSEAETEF